MNLTMAPPANLGFVGAGRMAQAIAGGVMKAFSDRPPTIFFSDPLRCSRSNFFNRGA